MTPRLRATHFLIATSFVLSLLACSSNDPAPDGGSKGGTPGPTATGGSLGKGGAQGLGGATVPTGAGGGLGTGGVAVDAGPGAGGLAVVDGGPDGAGPDGAPGAGGKPGTGGSSLDGGGPTGTGGTGAGGTTGGGSGEFGFTYRSPGSHTVSCTGTTGTMTTDAPDLDWLCTFNVGSLKGYVYVRTTANGATCLYSAVPTYKVELAQLSIGGVVTDLANPKYDSGGNHKDDALTFDYQGATYKYAHSSYGFGYRPCQNMDCINVEGGANAEQGCTSARTLPAVCVPINKGGTHDPLTDKFVKCPGDSSK